MKLFIGVFVALNVIVIGLYLGIYTCLLTGITQVISQINSPIIEQEVLILGILRLIATYPILKIVSLTAGLLLKILLPETFD